MSGRAPSWRGALWAAAASLAFTLLVYAASRRAGVNWLDERLVGAVSWRADSTALFSAETMDDVRAVYDLAPYTLLVVLLLGSVIWRRRVALAGLVCMLLAGANLTTWALQHRGASATVVQVLDEPAWGVYWPSGHTTAAVSLAAAAILVSTAAWRPFIIAAAVVVTTLGVVSNLVLQVHVPTDVLGGIGIAATWSFAAWAAQLRWPALLSPR